MRSTSLNTNLNKHYIHTGEAIISKIHCCLI